VRGSDGFGGRGEADSDIGGAREEGEEVSPALADQDGGLSGS